MADPIEVPPGAEEVAPLARVRELETANQALQTQATDLQQQLADLSAQHAALGTQLGDAQRQGLEHLRRALLAEHAGQVVPELLTGATVEELSTSVELAKAAFARATEAVRQQLQAQQVPAGNPARQGPDLEALPPLAKIAHGLSRGD